MTSLASLFFYCAGAHRTRPRLVSSHVALSASFSVTLHVALRLPSSSPHEKETHGVSAIRDQQEDQSKRQIAEVLATVPGGHRVLIYGDTFQSRMQPMDDEKAALLASKRQFLPLQSRIEKNRRNVWSGSRKISRSSSRHVWKSCGNGSRQTRNWNQPTLSKPKPSNKLWFGWQNKQRGNAKAVNQGIPVAQT